MTDNKTVTIIIINIFILCVVLLSGCANNNQKSTAVGPSLSSTYFEPKQKEVVDTTPKLDVIIPVFDPGLPKDPDDYEDENIWPELRRAEANRFAYKLKEKLEATGRFGSVRVTPDRAATGDLYVLGKIKESNGEEVEIDITVFDISGEEWLDESFDHEVSNAFHKNLRNKGFDPYDPVFEEAAAEIADTLDEYDSKTLEDLHYLADLRFGASFSEATFMQYIGKDGNEYELTGKPSDTDPMLQRVKAIRVRDRLFIDGLQNNYAAFSAQMNESYLMWQEQSLLEIQAKRAANRKSIGQALGGAALIGLGILSAIAGGNSSSSGVRAAGSAGLILGGIAGVSLISQSFRTSEEAKIHRDSLNELGRSVDMEMAPQVIAFDKKSVELSGDAKEQFMQWRTFLQRIYAEEMTPDVQF